MSATQHDREDCGEADHAQKSALGQSNDNRAKYRQHRKIRQHQRDESGPSQCLNVESEASDQILTETEGPGGGFLDDGVSPFGIYSRLNLYAAAGLAAERAASK